ncbi:tetratricopeptide repeat protein [Lacibacter luteus]|uniref:Tetratricopeptide repeat protein n=1 Tax=Lacibacter luteus TaxID=2508719 RepID=A0A4Q1CPT0_9BACT|nr:tetratricopeptide repeat protein [Lacibacter luteus]RXK62741.1 tetratricopeptide repeat protein [Lacibacter luteus]
MQLKALSIVGLLVLFSFGCNNNPPADATVKPASSTANKQVDELEKQVAANPQADSLREGLVEQLVKNNQYDKALAQVEQLLQKQPDNPAYLFMKADALERKADTINAITTYQQAIQSAGVFNEAELRLASLYAETGNKTAVILCDGLLKDASAAQMRSDVLFVKAAYYSKVKDIAKALAVYNQLIREDYTYMEAYIEKGLLFYDQQKYAEAWKSFQQSTNVSNKYADGYFWMAKAEEKMNKTKEAIDNYKRSLALDQSITEAREALKRLGEIK